MYTFFKSQTIRLHLISIFGVNKSENKGKVPVWSQLVFVILVSLFAAFVVQGNASAPSRGCLEWTLLC